MTSPAAASPAPTATPAPPARGKLQVGIKPNPVPFSGQPVAAGLPCAGQANTWFWDQVLTETGGSTVTITSVTTQVDSAAPNTVAPPQPMVVPANGSYTRNINMCFATPAGTHSVQVLYKGVDAGGNEVSVQAPVTTLSPK